MGIAPDIDMMSLEAVFALQRGRIERDRALEEDIQRKRFATPTRDLVTPDDELLSPVEYHVILRPHSDFMSLPHGYYLLKRLYA